MKCSLAFLLLLQCSCATFRTCNDSWWGEDKAKHFAAGFAIGAGTSLLLTSELDSSTAAGIGFGTSMAAGFAKEAYDLHHKKTCWSWRDIFWDFLGASAGASLALAMD